MRPTSAAQMPAAFTTTSHAIGPLSTTTPLTRPPPTVIATMPAPVSTLAPRARAPSVSAVARPAGSTWPSLGSQSAPSSDASVMSGNRSRASRALMSPTSSPNRRAQRSRSWSSLRRARPDATRRRPAVDRHLEPHEGPEERDDLEHALESVPSVLRRALSDDGELLGPERQEDPLAVPTDVRSDPQPLALPVHDALTGRDHPARQEIRDADEVGDEVGAGPRVDLLWAPDLLDPAVPHHRDAVGDRERLLLLVVDDAVVEADLARVGPLEAGDQAERRRLAATRAADEGDELPPADLQGEPVHGG